MALQHTLNASPIQAFRSSDVSATAVEHKKALVKTTIMVANSFIGSARQKRAFIARLNNIIRCPWHQPYGRRATVDKKARIKFPQ